MFFQGDGGFLAQIVDHRLEKEVEKFIHCDSYQNRLAGTHLYSWKRFGADRFGLAILQINLQDLWIAVLKSNILFAVLATFAYDLILGEPNSMTRMILAGLLSECRFLDGL